MRNNRTYAPADSASRMIVLCALEAKRDTMPPKSHRNTLL